MISRSYLLLAISITAATAFLPLGVQADEPIVTTYAGVRIGAGAADGDREAARFNDPEGFCVARDGNVYVSDSFNHTIRRIDQAGHVTTVAGVAMAPGSADGSGADARFNNPVGIAVSSRGVIYVADAFNHTIRKILPGGLVSTFAGKAGESGAVDGFGSSARFSRPYGLTIDGNDNLLVAEYFGGRVRRISPDGEVTTVAGGGWGYQDGPASQAKFKYVSDVAVDSHGNVIVADQGNAVIRRISTSGSVTTIAGKAGEYLYVDGSRDVARFINPLGVAVGPDDSIYVADTGASRVRKIAPNGDVSTIAEVDTPGGVTFLTRFVSPWDITVASDGSIFVLDSGNSAVRRIVVGVKIETVAGTIESYRDGNAEEALFASPYSIAIGKSRALYVADGFNHIVRKISAAGEVTTLAGMPGVSGAVDGKGAAARFNIPGYIAVDASENVFVTDYENQTVRKISPDGVVTTVAGKAGQKGYQDGVGSQALFSSPQGLSVDAAGNIYLVEGGNNTLRRISPDGTVTTVAGSAGNPGKVDGEGASARFDGPEGIAIDRDGNLVVADYRNHTIRRVTPAGAVTTIAGEAGSAGSVDGNGPEARFAFPVDVEADSDGNIWAADYGNHIIRKIDVTGRVSTVAGVAKTRGYRDGKASEALFNLPAGIAIGPDGVVYVGEYTNRVVRRLGLGVPVSDVAAIDKAIAPVGEVRTLTVSGSTSNRWSWSPLRLPDGSVARLSSTSGDHVTFAPDAPGEYEFQLIARSVSASSESVVRFTATCALPQRPSVQRKSGSSPSCTGEAVTLEVSGPADRIVWSTGETTRAIVVSPKRTATYSVRTFLGNCPSEEVSYTQEVLPMFSSVVLTADSSTAACDRIPGPTLTVAEQGAQASSRAWYYKVGIDGTPVLLPTTGATYRVNAAQFPRPGTYLVHVVSRLSCGSEKASNSVAITIDECGKAQELSCALQAAGGGSETFASNGRFGWMPIYTDIDLDGVKDIVYLADYARQVTVVKGYVGGRFRQVFTIDTNYEPTGLAIGDVDGDSLPDAVVAAPDGNELLVFRGTGRGTFLSPTAIAVTGGPVSALLIDVDRDGDLDIVTDTYYSGEFLTLTGDGKGNFTPGQRVYCGKAPLFARAVDLNKDGIVDVIVPCRDSNEIRVFRGDGRGGFLPAISSAVGVEPVRIAVGDVTGEGRLDVAVGFMNSRTSNGDIRVYSGDGSGGFSLLYSKEYAAMSDVTLADLDGDRRDDVIFTESRWGGLEIHYAKDLENGDRTLNPGYHVSALMSGDFNGDSKLDLLFFRDFGAATVLFGNGRGGYLSGPWPLLPRTFSYGATVADLNNDGKKDLVAVVPGGPEVLLATDKGFGSAIQYNSTLGWETSYGRSLVSGDFNGDRNADVATANSDASISLYFSDGHGYLGGERILTVSGRMSAVARGDFNGDGKIDLIAAQYPTEPAVNGLVTIFQGDGFTFRRSADVQIEGSPTGVAVGDLNADGKADFAVLTASTMTPYISGPGGFVRATSVTIDSRYSISLHVSEVNSDGFGDVIIATMDGIRVLIGRGDGTFAQPIKLEADKYFFAVATADIDRDGRMDIVGATDGATVIVFLHSGRTFQNSGEFFVGSPGYTIVAEDIDSDGEVEVVTPGGGINVVSFESCRKRPVRR